MTESHYKLRCNGQEDGSYLLSYGKGSKKVLETAESVNCRWQIRAGLNGDTTSYATLRELKEVFLKYAIANYGNDGVAVTPAAISREDEKKEKHADRQTRINNTEDRAAQISLWCMEYNHESVAVRYGAEREVFVLPPGTIDPALELCYSKQRDQYTWPHLFNNSTGMIVNKIEMDVDSIEQDAFASIGNPE